MVKVLKELKKRKQVYGFNNLVIKPIKALKYLNFLFLRCKGGVAQSGNAPGSNPGTFRGLRVQNSMSGIPVSAALTLIFIIILSTQALAIKIAAGPQEIILEGSSGKFSVFNPNDGTVEFVVEGGDGIFFNQTTGILAGNSKIDIELKAYEEGNILVKFLNQNLEPGVQLKVRKPEIPNYGIWIFLVVLGIGIFILVVLIALQCIRTRNILFSNINNYLL